MGFPIIYFHIIRLQKRCLTLKQLLKQMTPYESFLWATAGENYKDVTIKTLCR